MQGLVNEYESDSESEYELLSKLSLISSKNWLLDNNVTISVLWCDEDIQSNKYVFPLDHSRILLHKKKV